MSRKPLNAGFTGDVAPSRSVAAKTRSAIDRVKDEAGMVAAHASDHPAATGSVVVMVGLLGVATGYLLGFVAGSRDRRWRY